MDRTSKRCPPCGEDKLLTEFSRNRCEKDGLQVYCKPCVKAISAFYYRRRQAQLGKTVREAVGTPEGHKYFPGCEKVSPPTNWHRNASARDGYSSYCKCQFEDDPHRLRAAARYLELHSKPSLPLVADEFYKSGESVFEANLRLHLAS